MTDLYCCCPMESFKLHLREHEKNQSIFQKKLAQRDYSNVRSHGYKGSEPGRRPRSDPFPNSPHAQDFQKVLSPSRLLFPQSYFSHPSLSLLLFSTPKTTQVSCVTSWTHPPTPIPTKTKQRVWEPCHFVKLSLVHSLVFGLDFFETLSA